MCSEIWDLGKDDIDENGRCKASVYHLGKSNVEFRDLRTLISYEKLTAKSKKDVPNFTKSSDNVVVRMANYKLQKEKPIFHLDCCKSSKESFSFKPIQDLYDVLWENRDKQIVDSAETLISVKRALDRDKADKKNYPIPKKGQIYQWEELAKEESCEKLDKRFEDFFHAVATIGNFMPVPASNQKFLASLGERFDKELEEVIYSYYLSNKYGKKIIGLILNENFTKWLDSFGKEEMGWKNFVEKNYLNGSFVDENYNVVKFTGSLEQLTKMINKRSKVMLEAYKEKVELENYL